MTTLDHDDTERTSFTDRILSLNLFQEIRMFEIFQRNGLINPIDIPKNEQRKIWRRTHDIKNARVHFHTVAFPISQAAQASAVEPITRNTMVSHRPNRENTFRGVYPGGSLTVDIINLSSGNCGNSTGCVPAAPILL